MKGRSLRTCAVVAAVLMTFAGCGGKGASVSSNASNSKKTDTSANSITDTASVVSGVAVSEPDEETVSPTPGEGGQNSSSGDPDSRPELNRVEKVRFTHQVADEKESGLIEALDENGEIVWSHKTGEYECVELDRVAEVATFEYLSYWYMEDGKVIGLKWSDGSELFVNDDFRGASPTVCVDLFERVVYMCGYYGPALYGIDFDGKTVGRIAEVDGYYWPIEIKAGEDTVTVRFEGEPGGEVTVDKDTFAVINEGVG